MVEYWKFPFPFVLGLVGSVGDSSSVASVHYHIHLVWATVALVPPVEHCYTSCEFVAHDGNVGSAAETVEVARREVEEEAGESRVAAPSWSLPSSDWRNKDGRSQDRSPAPIRVGEVVATAEEVAGEIMMGRRRQTLLDDLDVAF